MCRVLLQRISEVHRCEDDKKDLHAAERAVRIPVLTERAAKSLPLFQKSEESEGKVMAMWFITCPVCRVTHCIDEPPVDQVCCLCQERGRIVRLEGWRYDPRDTEQQIADLLRDSAACPQCGCVVMGQSRLPVKVCPTCQVPLRPATEEDLGFGKTEETTP